MTPRHPSSPRLRHRVLAATATLLLLSATGPALDASTAQASEVAATTCTQTWGSLDSASGALSPGAAVTGVRSGRHACFDRLVVDLRGRVQGYAVRYTDVVRADGSGLPVPVRGGARLQVVVLAAAYDVTTGTPTYSPAERHDLVDVVGYGTLRQVSWAGSFEGRTTLGVGVRARLPYRVIVLAGPGSGSRLVIDVAHHW